MITVVVPASPIPSHPDTSILTATINSIRRHLPDPEIMLLFDGVRDELAHRRVDYDDHIGRVLWQARDWGAVYPHIFDEHRHQVGMLRHVMPEIRTPLMLWAEQDTPLMDEHIDWQACIDQLTSGRADIVRFAHESRILPAHRHMVVPGGDPGFVRTAQYSARPHLARCGYYERVLREHFSPHANTFLEDRLHGVCWTAYQSRGVAGWREHKIVYYHPDGNIQRSTHLDGREGDPKFDDTLVF